MLLLIIKIILNHNRSFVNNKIKNIPEEIFKLPKLENL